MLNFSWKGKNYLSPNSLVVNALTHCVAQLGINFGKEKVHKIIPVDFVVYFDQKYVTKWRCPIPPENVKHQEFGDSMYNSSLSIFVTYKLL